MKILQFVNQVDIKVDTDIVEAMFRVSLGQRGSACLSQALWRLKVVRC